MIFAERQILDVRLIIGQTPRGVACKMLIAKCAPVAQGIERSPPKPHAERWQVAARAAFSAVRSVQFSTPSRAKTLALAAGSGSVLDGETP
jgi:hypothetical protein